MLTVDDVAAIPLFSGLPAVDLERLARTSADLRLGTGEFAVHEGGEGALFVVLTGKNELQVVAPSKREAVDTKDESITARVNEQMAKDAQLKTAGIKAQTNAGVVSLSGEVPDLMTSAQASWSAWQVPGVKSVKNDLTVKEKA